MSLIVRTERKGSWYIWTIYDSRNTVKPITKLDDEYGFSDEYNALQDGLNEIRKAQNKLVVEKIRSNWEDFKSLFSKFWAKAVITWRGFDSEVAYTAGTYLTKDEQIAYLKARPQGKLFALMPTENSQINELDPEYMVKIKNEN